MTIVNCGYNFRHANGFRINRPSGSGDWLLLVVRSHAYFVLQGERKAVRRDSVIIFKEGTAQIYGADGEEYVNDWVHFMPDEEDKARIAELGIKTDTLLEVPTVLPLTSIIQSLLTERYSDSPRSDEASELLFRLLLLKLADLTGDMVRIENPALFEELTRLRADIYSEPERDWRIDSIARMLLVSQSYLQHLYKSYFGKSIKEDVTASRMAYAKYLLFSGDYTVAVISELCGYRNDVHFMRIFKERVGMTPSEYRLSVSRSGDKVKESLNKNPYCL